MAAPREPSQPASALEAVFVQFFRRMPKQSRSRAVVEAILQALDETSEQTDDVETLKVERVAERAGVGIGSLYEYFASKESLVGALVGRATEQNFEQLMAILEKTEGRSLQAAVDAMARAVARQYLDQPGRTRLLIKGIGRLGLWDVVVAERDRFAQGLAQRAQSYLPGAMLSELEQTMRIVADSIMGVLAGQLSRQPQPDVARWGDHLAALAWAIVASRHPEAR